MIDWDEYLNCIMSKEIPPTDQYKYGKHREYTVELEHSLLRVLQQEMLNQKRLEECKKHLFGTNFSEAVLFDFLDYDNKGFLIYDDVEYFIRNKYPNITTAKLERSWRRLEPDGQERITYRQFMKCIRPIYFYPAYTSHHISNKSLSPGVTRSRSASPDRKKSLTRNTKSTVRHTTGGNRKSYEVLEESYRQAVEREIGQSNNFNSVSTNSNLRSPVKRMKKVPKKYYSKNVEREKLETSLNGPSFKDNSQDNSVTWNSVRVTKNSQDLIGSNVKSPLAKKSPFTQSQPIQSLKVEKN
jgi:hypothetical protein